MTSTYLKILMLIAMLALFNACEDDDIQTSSCDLIVSIDANKFKNGESDFFRIISASITNDCLEIEYSASGCDGKNWEEEMVADDLILESLPPQRSLKMLLENKESCAAVFTKIVSFDLSAIQLDEYVDTGIYLNIDGFDDQLLYTYNNDSSIEVKIQKKWDLVNVNGGLTGVMKDFPSGVITWDFEDSKVNIENNNTEDVVYDGFDSGIYDYSIELNEGSRTISVNGQDLGVVSISNGELVIDQRASDGFQLRFSRH